jgi:cyclohexyl-isocyanide hydratase
MNIQAPRFGFLLFPRLTQLDLTGPYEVLARVPGASVHLIWKTIEPVASDTGMRILANATFSDCPELDLLLVPGGAGVNELLGDSETLEFLRRSASRTRYLASVCTGALALGAAGLLKGRRAATHWTSREFLEAFGAVVVPERVVVDGPLFTGGGVTAGIDIALRIVGELLGEPMAKAIQLSIEYAPQPPYDAGSPEKAGSELTGLVRQRAAPMLESRAAAVRLAAKKLGLGVLRGAPG